VDFQDSFGNFASCFAVEQMSKQQTQQTSWSGPMQVIEEEPVPYSTFTQELM
jgi:hypothetical protein